MHIHQIEALSSVSLVEFGRRLRSAREAKGLTQAVLAADKVSPGYLSRVEAGQLRLEPAVLEGLAARLGTTVDLLIHGVPTYELEDISLALTFAELALECGDPSQAEVHSQGALDRATAGALEDVEVRARFVLGLALEAQRRFDEAIPLLDAAARDAVRWTERLQAGVALCRTLRETGDFARAVEIGEQLFGELTEAGMHGTDEGVQLAVTLAAAHYESGDTGRALRACMNAIGDSEESGSPTACAAAYWNASLIHEKRGATPDALVLAQKALALMGEGHDARNLARLRTTIGIMLLSLDPPAVDDARGHLERAARELPWPGAGDMDAARNGLGLARVALLQGDPGPARQRGTDVYTSMRAAAPILAAEAKVLAGEACANQGDTAAAIAAYQAAATVLTGLGADRSAARVWLDLAQVLDRLGEGHAAREAFQSAAAAGIRNSGQGSQKIRPQTSMSTRTGS